ncbi:tRNA (N6-threonylcarbamoyladenosine(37)-N6)-methyltransferase TrmO [Candidatus Woesearchaeota archaeon]|nr:tRNA (N6-threonylcarbamoyladenosine(37)-N6)-methyltransferase TrmO [Candidatus Woesearchaeota archaeon]
MGFCYKPIGVIHSNYKQRVGVPIQGALSKDSRGWVEVKPEYKAGLKDIEGFSHIILVYHFHLSKGYSLLTKPFLENKEHGVFATRAPKRPNPIGVSVVRLDSVKGNILYVSEVDIVDGTPLLDIKPYIERFDLRENTRKGWIGNKLKNITEHHADHRFD